MTDAFLSVNGERCIGVTLHVPGFGPWFADVLFEVDPDVSGAVELRVGSLTLQGTVDPGHNGTRGLQRFARVLAGGGGWSTLVAAKAYHNDAGVKALLVAQDAAREVGETLGDFVPATEKVGKYYARQAGPASRALEDAIGAGTPWWVGYDGVTRAGDRSSAAVSDDDYDVLEVVPDERRVEIALDDFSKIGIGSVLSKGLDAPLTVRDLRIEVTEETSRVIAWCGADEVVPARLVHLFRALVARVTDGRLFGKWRYRVVRMSGDRVELQVIEQDVGLPNLLPISMVPGIAGAHAVLTPGSEVLVEFIEGNRARPVVTHFAGKDGNGWEPVDLVLAATSKVKLGSATAADPVALKSDLTALKSAINGAGVTAGDGGAAFKSALLTALSAWPASSTKVVAV